VQVAYEQETQVVVTQAEQLIDEPAANAFQAALDRLNRELHKSEEADRAREAKLKGLEVTPRSAQSERAKEAKMKGFEGDACHSCGNFTLVRNGTCLKCVSCGSTSGCS
jgi:ribonucleoside-diphosphate reductase alpha chain